MNIFLDFALFLCFNMNIAKKKNLFRARYLVLIYTSIEAHCRIFVTGGSFFATNGVQQKSFGRGVPRYV